MADIANPVGGNKFRQFVKDLIQVERQPIRLAEARKEREQAKLQLLQEVLGKFRTLEERYEALDNWRKFRVLKADWPAKELMDVAIDNDVAETGEYQIEIQQLAGKHSMISNGYESPKSEVGIGYFVYDTPDGDSRSVFIGPGDATLQGLADRINSTRDMDLQASVINDGSGEDNPWRIVIQSKSSGIDNDVDYPGFYFLDGDLRFYKDNERSSQNAILNFNGFEVMNQKNRFDLLRGVTFDLKQAKEDYEFTLLITEDVEAIADKVQALVDALNDILKFINVQNQLDADSDTSRTLGGDTALFTVESRIRNWIFQPFLSGFDEEDEEVIMHLSEVGVRFERDGTLSFDREKFKKITLESFDFVGELFVGEDNFIPQIRNMTQGVLLPEFGVLGAREKGIRDRIDAIDRDIVNKERHLARREQYLKRQFGQLEGLLGSMQSQQQYLRQALGSPGVLPGVG